VRNSQLTHRFRIFTLVLCAVSLGLFAFPEHALFAQESNDESQVESSILHSPKSALLKSAMVPGWGQIYNKQRIKVPVIYAGLGGIGALAVYFNSRHTLYDQAYLFKVFEGQEGVQYPQYESDYNEIAQGRNIGAESLRLQRNAHRRNRDLSVVGILAVYSLNLLDAYVNGHLVDFDVKEDISLGPDLENRTPVLSLKIKF